MNLSITKKIKNLPFYFGVLLVLLLFVACQTKSQKSTVNEVMQEVNTSLSAKDKYELAKKVFAENPEDADGLIWFGRRAAYLGNYEEAISIFTKGIKLHPEDAKMYRHRGHRFISTRRYDEAIEDFEKAVDLIRNQKDETEPDGLPNAKNIPLSTLHGNIWYHLGLAYYLKNDMKNALHAFSNRTVTEKYDDNIVSGGHWLYMILSRQDNIEEAELAISRVHDSMEIIENDSYYKMCLFYKGLISEDELKIDDPKSYSSNVISYGLGNWYLYKKQDTVKAKEYYRDLLDNGNKYSFAYLAAESDWERIFNKK